MEPLSASADTTGANANDDNFQSPHQSSLQKLMWKQREARQLQDIFYVTDPPENESPSIEPAPPGIFERLLPGIAPQTIWFGLGAIGLVLLLKQR